MGKKAKKVRRQDVLRQWFCAALLHDVGYVIEIGKGWSKLLELFDNTSFSSLRDGVSKITIESLRQKAIDQKDWNFEARHEPENDHGVASAIHALELFESLGNRKKAGMFNDALLAMAHHNHSHSNISFESEPLTAWLVICDEVQEWDRPWTNLENAALSLSAAVAFPHSESPDWHKDSSDVLVNIQTTWKRNRIQSQLASKDSRIEFTVKYSHEIHYQDRLFSSWLCRSASLQRIELKKEPFNVFYHLTSQLQAPPGLPDFREGEPRMERLRRLVREKRLWCIHDWLPRPKNRKTTGKSAKRPRCVEYDFDENDRLETVTLNVKEHGENPPILDSLDRFWKAANDWSGAHENWEVLD
jgi:hypothetical protein